MMKHPCDHLEPLCRCINWKDEGFEKEIGHLIRNFEFLRFDLAYEALEPGQEIQLCEIGRCRTCGGRICFSTSLSDPCSAEELMTGLYRRTFHRWRCKGRPLPDGVGRFEELFASLFHKEDQESVRSWLAWADAEGILQSCRDAGNEEV